MAAPRLVLDGLARRCGDGPPSVAAVSLGVAGNVAFGMEMRRKARDEVALAWRVAGTLAFTAIG